MKKSNEEETVTFNAKVTLKKDEYEKYKSGETKSNKGLRNEDGKLSSIPDFEEVYEEFDYADTWGDKHDNYRNDYDSSYYDCTDEDEEYDYEIDPEVMELYAKLGALAAGFVSELFKNAYSAAKPYVIKTWREHIVPGTKKIKTKISFKSKKPDITEHKAKNSVGSAVSSIDSLNALSGVLDSTYEEYVRHMTNEEAQQHLLNIYILTLKLAYEIKQLSMVEITNNERLSMEYSRDIERLTQTKIIEGLNLLLSERPDLLDESKIRDLTNALGYHIMKDGLFVPLDENVIKRKLEIYSNKIDVD